MNLKQILIVMHKKYLIFFLFILFAFNSFTESYLPPKVKNIIETSFKKKSESEILQTLISGISGLTENKEKFKALEFLAEYELRLGFFIEAAEHYQEAAELTSGEKAEKLLLESLKSYIAAGETEKARVVYEKASLFFKKPLTKTDLEAAVCLQWLKIAENKDDEEQSLLSVLKTLRSYVRDSQFSAFHPAILLTLWWIDNDITAKNTLEKLYPDNLETTAVKGNILIKPGTFWYLMPKTKKATESFYKEIRENTQVKHTIPTAYQIGFFKNEEYAKAQAVKLRQQGFTVEIKKEKRQSGTIYFAVFVLETQNGQIGNKLKDAGYESFPVFE